MSISRAGAVLPVPTLLIHRDDDQIVTIGASVAKHPAAEGAAVVVMIPPNFAPEPKFPESRQIIGALRHAGPERMILNFRRSLSWHSS